MSHLRVRPALPKLLAPSVRKRVFGGFAAVLLLLAALAVVALRSLDAVGAGASRVSEESAQATALTGVALLVGEARARVVQYALSATMDDQKAAQASLTELGQAIGRSATGGELGPLAANYDAAVDAGIAAIEARRSSVEQMRGAATELRTIVSATTQLLDRDTEPVLMAAAARLADSFGASDGAAFRFVASRAPADANAADSALQAFRGAIAAVDGASAGNRRVQRFLKGMAEPLDRFGAQLQRVVAADEQLRATTEARDVASAAILRAVAQQHARANASQSEATAAMLAKTRSARWESLLTAASAMGVGLLLAWLIGRSIARPVGAMTTVMRELAGGNLDVTIPNAGRRDELGEMAHAIVVFKDNAVAVRHLQMEQEHESERAEAKKREAMKLMAETIESSTGESLGLVRVRTVAMTATANAMSASAGRTDGAAESAGGAAGLVRSNAQAVAGAAEELTASIQEISRQMSLSATVVGEAVAAGSETRATIEALNEEVGRIGAVVDMIGEIAAKTNLLALNATIEAARAGDAGKGFAVVASEVKALAGQTAHSTRQITQHIDQVRAATGASVAAVVRIEQTITEVGAIARSISAAVAQQGEATADIARNVTETAAAANEMATRCAEVSAEAKETERQAMDVRQNAGGLDQAMEELRRSVVRAVRYSTHEADRRSRDRPRVDLPCRMTLDGHSYEAQVIDLSDTGAQIRGGPPVREGGHGTLLIDAVAYPLPFVVMRGGDDSLGVAFELDDAVARQFSETLGVLTQRRAA